MSMFKPATKAQTRLRLAIEGTSGAGKTYTALRAAHLIGKRIAVIDTENRSASKYVGTNPDGIPWAFDVLDLAAPYSPDRYVEAIRGAEAAGYDVIVIDSMAHMWSGKGGMLDLVDASGSNGNSFDGWRKCKPLERKFWDAIVACKIHLIATFRSKTEWVIEKNEKGKNTPRKVGLKADQRADTEYEFDVAIRMDDDHIASIIKTRCEAIDGETWQKPGPSFVMPIMAWLQDGAPAVYVEPQSVAQTRPAAQPGESRPAPTVNRHDDAALAALRETAVKALTDAGILVAVTAELDAVPASWTRDELRRASAMLAEHKRNTPPAPEPDPAPVSAMDARRMKRIRECDAAGVLDATVERYGDPARWDHAACDAIKADLAALVSA